MIVDAHQHFWRLAAVHREWPTPDLEPIYRDFELEDLLAVARPMGVGGCVTVQSQPNEADTAWLLSMAAAEPFILGVVGWTDLAAPDAADRIAGLAGRPKLCGLRPMLQGLADDAWILRPEVQPALDAMEESDLTLDALVYGRHLPHLLDLCSRRPGLKVVIDHGAKPPIASGDIGVWKKAISPFAELPHVCCKVSGLLTEGAPGQGREAYRPVLDHLMTVFGPRRLMWGSDWPVVNLVSDYAEWLNQARAGLGLDDRDAAAVFGQNAVDFYRLQPALEPA